MERVALRPKSLRDWRASTEAVIYLSKAVGKLSKLFNLGAGSSIAGVVALRLDPSILKKILSTSSARVVFVTGTNGKTTTGNILQRILKKAGYTTIANLSGANLLGGVTSAVLYATKNGVIQTDFLIFEVDENVLPRLLQEVVPECIIMLNLFRDQLDRYGEIDSIINRWEAAFSGLSATTFILNADDPRIAYIGQSSVARRSIYFGIQDATASSTSQAPDSNYCPRCKQKLQYDRVFFSHLGVYRCAHCGLQHPAPYESVTTSPLIGIYNQYNTEAAATAASYLGIDTAIINQAVGEVETVFGRQEVIRYNGANVHIFLSKNPTSFNQSLETIVSLGAKKILFVLNDRIPDGRDISWIWDIAIETYLPHIETILISGDRCYDMALRMKYTGSTPDAVRVHVEENLKEAIEQGLSMPDTSETLYVLPTYSAMLDVRKILTGKKI